MRQLTRSHSRTCHGRKLTWTQSLQDTYTDGIVFCIAGRRIYERYFGALQPQRPHACFSITKSYAATLAATLIHEGRVGREQDRLVLLAGDDRHRLCRMRRCARCSTCKSGLPIRNCMRIPKRTSGITHAPAGCGLVLPDTQGPGNFYEYLQTLRPRAIMARVRLQDRQHRSHVLGDDAGHGRGVAGHVERADLVAHRLRGGRLYLTVDSIGVAMGGGGLNASLRDLVPLRRTHALRRGMARPANHSRRSRR